jgi:drug/metabolite transporter, DME family
VAVAVRYKAALAVGGAAALWGTSGAVVSGLAVSGTSAAALVEFSTGLLLLAVQFAVTRRIGIRARHLRALFALGALEAVNVACYYSALRLAPVAPVMALHLTEPVLIMLARALRERRFSRRSLPVFLSMLAALVVLTLARQPGGSTHAALGFTLSLLSAVCLAVFLSGVAQVTRDISPLAGSGGQMALSGLILSPALAFSHPSAQVSLVLIATAVSVFAPACLLCWFGLRHVAALPASSILLLEAVFGSAAALALYGARIPGLDAVAGVLILASVLMQLQFDAGLSRTDTGRCGRVSRRARCRRRRCGRLV